MLLPAKKLLVNYSELLSRLIGSYTLYNSRSPKFFNDIDAIEILTTWDENHCKELLKNLLMNLKNGNGGDKALNPWCVYSGKSCNDCQYKARHGLCSDSTSDYTLTTKAIYKQHGMLKSICNIPGLIKILYDFLEVQLVEKAYSSQEAYHLIESVGRKQRSWLRSIFFT